MKTKTIYIFLLIMLVAGTFLTLANEILPDNSVAQYSNDEKNAYAGTILINDGSKTKNVSYEASGYCYKVVDGDTIWVEGVGKIRLVGVNTPERNEPGFTEAKDFVTEKCLYKTVYLDIDDKKNKDRYNRTLAVVYTEDINLNKVLIQNGLGEIMFIPPSEFPKGLGT